MKLKIISSSPQETQTIGKLFVQDIVQKTPPSKTAVVVSLEGDLGSGKTEFLKGVAKGLGIKERITSPTFVIMRQFPLSGKKFRFLWHIDCYRVSASDLSNLFWEEICHNPHNLVFIEWGNKVHNLLPSSYWKVKLKVLGEKERLLTIEI